MPHRRNRDKYQVLSQLSKDVKAEYLKGGPQNTEEFLPFNTLETLVKKERVLLAFQDTEIEQEKHEDLATWVVKSGKRLFLILVLLTRNKEEHLSYLEDLKNDGIDDSALPLNFQKTEPYYGFSVQGEEVEDRKKFHAFQDWEDNDLQLFETHQWPLLAPIFGVSTKFRHQLDRSQPLPYLDVARKPASSGFFGEVSRAEIHRAHIDPQFLSALGVLDPESQGIAIAIKKAKDNEDLYEFFDKETRNLKTLQEIVSPHLIQPISAYQRGSERCLTFPWAEGGNLGNYWDDYEKGRQDLGSLRWLIAQFVGLFSTLQILHEQNCRHGDLKPENILWFKEYQGLGTLRIADMGLSAFHEKDADTKKRNWKKMSTMTPSGTSRYEPPEMDDTRGKGISRSRQYDIWSMGCIMMELLIWLMYGFKGVTSFRKKTLHFWTNKGPDPKTGKVSYYVHDYVVSCLGIMEKQLKGNAAYTALLRLVRERLLVIDVSENYVSSPDHREIASVLHISLMGIYRSCETQDDYLTSVDLEYPSSEINAAQYQSGPISKKDELLTAPGASQLDPLYVDKISQDSLDVQITVSDGDEINVSKDGEIPRLLLRQPTIVAKTDSLSVHETTLSDNQEYVKFPELTAISLPPKIVSLRQDGAVVGIENGPNLLSIYVDYETGSDIPEGAQLGLPKLLNQGSPEQFALLKEWIKTCDATHEICRGNHDGGNNENHNASTMPTRLVELGTTLRIVESASIKPSVYVALSHCWGKLSELERFCAFNHNISHLKEFIDFNSLPKTFRDAITVARGIGVNYLWIDSLCIIQDNKDDWEHELARMEQVFSSAYCTIGASSSKSSLQGFLNYRKPRACIEIKPSDKDKKTLYVCPNIDDFHRDVDLGELNSRGWVLQERALSRRTIFYTSTQVYWECGSGVHCETLARLQNSKAAFLGDANFPESALEYYRDGRQMLVQDLYERYSGLAFTKNLDRPMAILGLQERLAKAFKTQAAYGFFGTYFARLLLWKRHDTKWMTRIIQRPGSRYRVPTWSWFSKVGAIKYLDLKFQETNWAAEDFINPFRRSASFSLGRASAEKENFYVTFDEGQDFEVIGLRCVLIGRDKIEGGLENMKYHVLIIHVVSGLSGEDVYERVGVASLKPEHVASEGSWVDIR
ncbi:hypothetical protein E0Z10_g981 [Xylaria hypoxylon]|uniref:Protein kinase domain-containing protein n=1 Tax=Xylaria hypoxylon TaxID=37992 RepID=A0A4Z0Z7S3_9PEZI|nr:hypothetical protein E0Z10_g981 [Xylaria hypoxylon]